MEAQTFSFWVGIMGNLLTAVFAVYVVYSLRKSTRLLMDLHELHAEYEEETEASFEDIEQDIYQIKNRLGSLENEVFYSPASRHEPRCEVVPINRTLPTPTYSPDGPSWDDEAAWQRMKMDNKDAKQTRRAGRPPGSKNKKPPV